MENNNDIKFASRRNVLTSGLVSTYPFISSSIFDEEGILIGTIKDVVNTQNELDRYANVSPATDFSKLETVLVITQK